MNQHLKEAIEDDLPAVVEGLLAEMPQWVEHADTFGETPLMLAVVTMNRSLRCIRVLIEAGANVNATNTDGSTVLYWLVGDHGYFPYPWSAKSSEIVPLLVQAGAGLEAEQHHGFTPLMLALIDGSLAEIRALLAAGAEPNKIVPQNNRTAWNWGESILTMAWSYFRPVEAMKALIEAGADVNMRDTHGQTTLEFLQGLDMRNYARFEKVRPFSAQRLECIELLQQF